MGIATGDRDMLSRPVITSGDRFIATASARRWHGDHKIQIEIIGFDSLCCASLCCVSLCCVSLCCLTHCAASHTMRGFTRSGLIRRLALWGERVRGRRGKRGIPRC